MSVLIEPSSYSCMILWLQFTSGRTESHKHIETKTLNISFRQRFIIKIVDLTFETTTDFYQIWLHFLNWDFCPGKGAALNWYYSLQIYVPFLRLCPILYSYYDIVITISLILIGKLTQQSIILFYVVLNITVQI